MHLHFRTEMQQRQIMAPRMIQSMEILQLSNMDLQERIEKELVENVVLEHDGPSVEPAETEYDEGPAESTEIPDRELDEKELVVTSDSNNEADFERLVEISSEWPEDNIGAGSRVSSNRLDDLSDRAHDTMANAVARSPSLHEHLVEQFGFYRIPEHLHRFGEYLIQNLDHNGRLQSTLAEVVQVYGRPITMDEAEDTLFRIQRLDPPGVGARDIRETLLLQIDPTDPYRDVLKALIQHHLEDVAANRLPLIQKKTGYSLELIKDAILELQKLNPYPGRDFEEIPVQRVTAELSVEKNDEGRYIIKLEDEYVPHLRINRRYQELLRNDSSPQTREFVKQKVESARWLIEAIESRYRTLRKVAQAIVDHQTAFLDDGPEFMAPLKMQQIADLVGVHVTTVSRAVDDKWMQTPRGLFCLRNFFGGGTQNSEGEDVAWDIIRIKLREIIDAEDKSKPLSDEDLVSELAKHGYDVARRTVTKYRKVMDIPSSRQRRQY